MGASCCKDGVAAAPPHAGYAQSRAVLGSGGRRLGGGEAPDPRARHQIVATAAERRFAQGAGRVVGGSGQGAGVHGSARRPAPREAAAAAALARASGNEGGISGTKRQQLEDRRARDELIGKIQHYYAVAGEDPPIGLPAASIDALRRHLERAKVKARGSGRADAVAARVLR
eukprot:CAMPEP_0196791636 /NCGR_PEP_ID=MMETSP1104-20130614/30161_1 /TAXON_ID=33652 /ORGANISM="Cafeteria sp., Strain Caron Lab Isolate" /LENGTH=171 /DNA_ID=CAMNT_0042161999 /DNA_START=15 /DNA_END=530 /DNA_ORIENTATION=+